MLEASSFIAPKYCICALSPAVAVAAPDTTLLKKEIKFPKSVGVSELDTPGEIAFTAAIPADACADMSAITFRLVRMLVITPVAFDLMSVVAATIRLSFVATAAIKAVIWSSKGTDPDPVSEETIASAAVSIAAAAAIAEAEAPVATTPGIGPAKASTRLRMAATGPDRDKEMANSRLCSSRSAAEDLAEIA
jgi:hypothetical protein